MIDLLLSNQVQQKNTTSKELKNTNLEINTFQNIGLSSPLLPPQKINIPKPTKGLQIILEQLNLSSIPLLPAIAAQLENVDKLKLLLNQKRFLPTDIIDKYNAKFWTVYAFSGVNFSKQRMTNLPSKPGSTLLEYDKNYVGVESVSHKINLGLRYEYAIDINSSRKIDHINDPKTFSQGFRTFLTAGYRF